MLSSFDKIKGLLYTPWRGRLLTHKDSSFIFNPTWNNIQLNRIVSIYIKIINIIYYSNHKPNNKTVVTVVLTQCDGWCGGAILDNMSAQPFFTANMMDRSGLYRKYIYHNNKGMMGLVQYTVFNKRILKDNFCFMYLVFYGAF